MQDGLRPPGPIGQKLLEEKLVLDDNRLKLRSEFEYSLIHRD